MAAYDAHLRRIHNHEVFYHGEKPVVKSYTTDRDIIDAQHKFLLEGGALDFADPLVKEYYASLIKDCVLIDLSRYKEKQVSL